MTFMNPYIKFCKYPEECSFWKELFKPQPSPFIKVINKEIYKTWNGEALIRFKWKKYGRYHYYIIWMQFFVLLGCFTIATTIPESSISDDTRKKLFTASIIFGIYHIFNEVRQLIYDCEDWLKEPWNMI